MNKYSLERQPSDLLGQTADHHRTLRKQKGLSQAELARRSGISLGSLKRFEQTGQISFESLLRLANTLDRLTDFERLLKPGPDPKKLEALFSDQMHKS